MSEIASIAPTRSSGTLMRTQMRELRQGGQLGCCLGKSQQSHRRQTAATGFRPRGASQVIRHGYKRTRRLKNRLLDSDGHPGRYSCVRVFSEVGWSEATIYAAASGLVGSCFSPSALKPNLASSSCTIRAVCALCRIWVNNAPSAMPNISIASNNRTSGGTHNRRGIAANPPWFSAH